MMRHACHPAFPLPLTKGELEGVALLAAGQNPPQSPLGKGGRKSQGGTKKSGFTLVELLVVIAILLLLMGLTLAVYNTTLAGDRIRGAARQMQSALLGAQSRAILAREPRGLRLAVDQNEGTLVTSLVYIDAPKTYGEGLIRVGRADVNLDNNADSATVNVIRGWNTGWSRLVQTGLLVDGARMRIPAHGPLYTVYNTTNVSQFSGQGYETLYLTTDYRGSVNNVFPAVLAVASPLDYALELLPGPMPGEQPILLPNGVVIDLDYSLLPPGWIVTPAAGGNPNMYSTRMDILFSPRGPVTGGLAAQGALHLVLAERQDAAQNLGPASSKGEKLLVTLFTRTGHVASYPVYVFGPDGAPGQVSTDDDGANGADDLGEVGWTGTDDNLDLYRFATTGEAAGR